MLQMNGPQWMKKIKRQEGNWLISSTETQDRQSISVLCHLHVFDL